MDILYIVAGRKQTINVAHTTTAARSQERCKLKWVKLLLPSPLPGKNKLTKFKIRTGTRTVY
jgi:hypothetical protein